MIGDTISDDGKDFEVIWDGGGLLPDRTTTKTGLWETIPPNRRYNKTGNHTKPKLDNPIDRVETGIDWAGLDDEFERFVKEVGNGTR